MSRTVLIVDDDPIQRRLLEALVHRFGYAAESVESGVRALARLASGTDTPIDLMILDLVMPDLDGMAVLTRMRDCSRAVPTIVQTMPGSIEAVISAMRAGAVDFVVKPVGAERLQVSIKNALRTGTLEDELRRMSRRAGGAPQLKDLACKSEEMMRVVRLGERAARSSIPVLLEGEPGVGKELVARAIQSASDRRGRPFVAVDCAALPETLVASVLFGHERGVLVGATDKTTGKLVQAQGGTLFLDGIGALPPDAQTRLLRALCDGEVDPVGGNRPVKVDVRLIAATGQDLIELVKRGRFREDLYYRLNVFPILIPPLRARPADIVDLACRSVARFAAEEGKHVRGLTAEAAALLTAYDWPGNQRQLENAVFRAVVLADHDELTVAEFPQIAARVEGFDVRIPPLATLTPPALRPEPEIERIEVRDPNVLALLDESGDVRTLETLEAEAIRFAMSHYRGQMSAMARKLGIGRSTLYRKMREYGLFQDDVVADDAMAGDAVAGDAAAA